MGQGTYACLFDHITLIRSVAPASLGLRKFYEGRRKVIGNFWVLQLLQYDYVAGLALRFVSADVQNCPASRLKPKGVRKCTHELKGARSRLGG